MKAAQNNFQFSIFNFQSIFKNLIVLLLLVSCYLLLVPSAVAQTYNAPNTNPDVPNNLHNWTQNVTIEVISAMTCQIAGIDPTNPNQACLGIDPKTKKIGFVKNGGGAIGLMGNMIAMTFTPPLHVGDYTNYLAQNFGLVKPAYAQTTGTGFDGLKPLLGIWTVFRNIVYMIYAAVFAVIGFAIMLRIKIDPRTVMSISNQLPKIIISILLVTFSYAIAGVLVDVMYVSTYVIMNTFSDAQIANTIPDQKNRDDYLLKVTNTQHTFNGDNALGVFNSLVAYTDVVTSSAGGVKDIVQNLFGTSANTAPAEQKGYNNPFTEIGDKIGTFLKGIPDLLKNALGAIIGWIAGALALLIIGIAILWAMFRLWFQLLSAYVFFLIDVVLGPFWLIAGIIPASPIGLSEWLRELLSNLVVFPTTITMFLLGKVFISAFSGASYAFVPPLIGNINGNGGSGISAIGAFIGLGIILITPQVTAMAKDLLKPPPFKYTAGVGQALGVGPGIASGAFNSVFSPYGSLTTMTRAGSFFGAIKRGEGLRGAFKAVQTPGGEAVHNPPPHQSK